MIREIKLFFNTFKKTDSILWAFSLFCVVYGLVLILSVSISSNNVNNNLFLVQAIAIGIGIFISILLSLTNYKTLCKFWYLWAFLSLALMAYTFKFGWSAHGIGGNAWISIGSLNLQPSEIVKIFFMLTFAKHVFFLKSKNLLHKFKGVIQLFLHALVPIAMVKLQGDDGTLLIFVFMFLFMSLGAGVQLRYFLIFIALSIAASPLIWKFLLGDYQRQRFLTLFNLEENLKTYGWQQYQAKVSIASGQLFGKGLFVASRVKSGIVSVQESDFIFSVAGESLGLAGCLAIIILLAVIALRVLYISFLAKNIMGKTICFGFFGLLFSQSFINIGMCLAMMPVVGITLPFFSCGGSSIISVFFGIGLVQSIYVNKFDENSVKYKFKHMIYE